MRTPFNIQIKLSSKVLIFLTTTLKVNKLHYPVSAHGQITCFLSLEFKNKWFWVSNMFLYFSASIYDMNLNITMNLRVASMGERSGSSIFLLRAISNYLVVAICYSNWILHKYKNLSKNNHTGTRILQKMDWSFQLVGSQFQ